MLIDTQAENASVERLRVYVALGKLPAGNISGELDGVQVLHRPLPARKR